VGTLLAWGLGALFLRHFPPLALLACMPVAFLLGVWACGATGRRLGVPDHGAMVWDEIVAFLAVLALVPRELAWQGGAFVAFRAFDIVKPPPIRALERRWHGGLGVMADDVLAAGYTLLVLAALKRLLA
jgi:phosphatidylglycerophosphatase A